MIKISVFFKRNYLSFYFILKNGSDFSVLAIKHLAATYYKKIIAEYVSDQKIKKLVTGISISEKSTTNSIYIDVGEEFVFRESNKLPIIQGTNILRLNTILTFGC